MDNYGLKDWDDVEIKQVNQNQNRRDIYMRLGHGSNVLRVLTKPHEYLVHRYDPNNPTNDKEKNSGYGERVMSSMFHGSDPLVDRGFKPKRRWLVGILDRKTSSYKIMDMSVSVFKAVQELVRDEDWGDPSQYDIDVKVDKQGGPSGYYTVIPKSKKPLSAADLDIKSQVDLEDLKRRCTPPTPEKVAELVAAIEAKANGQTEESTNQESEESDMDFPAVEGSDNT